jgi:hypothetical protein
MLCPAGNGAGHLSQFLSHSSLSGSQLLVSVSSVGWVPPLGFAALLRLVTGARTGLNEGAHAAESCTWEFIEPVGGRGVMLRHADSPGVVATRE